MYAAVKRLGSVIQNATELDPAFCLSVYLVFISDLSSNAPRKEKKVTSTKEKNSVRSYDRPRHPLNIFFQLLSKSNLA